LQERIYVISGASSGIGRALAIKLAGSDVVLGLVGRDAARLAHTAEACTSRGASIHALVADVRRRDELRASLLQFDADHPVDCVIANAGVSVGTSPTGEIETEDETFALLETNLTGALATALPLIPRMRARRRGRVVFISSIAALAPLPDAAAYSASKAALLAYGLAKRERLRADGIKVNVVCPGFVTTPMAGHHLGWKPLRFHWKTRRGASCAGFNAIARSLPFHGPSYGFALLADAARAVASSRIERIPLPHCAAGMKLRLIRRHRRGWSKRLCALVRWPFEYTGHLADL